MRLFHFTAAQHALSAISFQRIKVAIIRELNDPFELMCIDGRDKKARKALNAFKNWVADRSGILCFSPKWATPLMWSHYANKHSGVALELEVSAKVVTKVRYSKHRVPWDVPHILANGGFKAHHADTIFGTKSHHWSYEDERRVAVRLSDCEKDSSLYFEKFSPSLELKGVVLGPLCKLTDEDVKAALPRGKELNIRNARLAHKSFDIVPDKSKKPRDVVGAA